PQNDGVNGLKSLFSSASRTKANAPNKSGRLLDPLILRFHTVCFGSSYRGIAYTLQELPKAAIF
ncbi:hypothetical protein, partial [Pseudomonas sp. A-RE-19]|uniref:hypothetical protein n=1 Tax=Pseudomonas sp. A-RE-19 TaxID=2832401 RepID=UPI001CBC4743